MFSLKTKGFTLLEILLAMFIFTIISMIVVGALHSVISTQSGTEKNAKRFSELQVTFALMARDIEQTVNRPITTPNGGIENAFIGNTTAFTFTHAGVANPTGSMQRSTLQRTRYRFAKEKLIRDTWPQLDQTTHSVAQPKTLLNNVESASFEYLDKKNNFQNRWPPASEQGNVSETPRAVRINIELPDLGKISQLYIIPGQPLEKT